jgi:hypothetical protein
MYTQEKKYYINCGKIALGYLKSFKLSEIDWSIRYSAIDTLALAIKTMSSVCTIGISSFLSDYDFNSDDTLKSIVSEWEKYNID